MANINNNFVVQTGLTVGAVTISAANGDINSTGNLTVGNTTISSNGTVTVGSTIIHGTTGDITVSGNLNVSGSTVSATPGTGDFTTLSAANVSVGSTSITSTVTTTTSTTLTAIATVPMAACRSAMFTVQGYDATGSKNHTCTILAVNNGTTASSVEYGSVDIGGQTATFSVGVGAGSMELFATPTSSNSTVFKVTTTATSA
jgi:hypothetical protein